MALSITVSGRTFKISHDQLTRSVDLILLLSYGVVGRIRCEIGGRRETGIVV